VGPVRHRWLWFWGNDSGSFIQGCDLGFHAPEKFAERDARAILLAAVPALDPLRYHLLGSRVRQVFFAIRASAPGH
jgi:hypothetical protein